MCATYLSGSLGPWLGTSFRQNSAGFLELVSAVPDLKRLGCSPPLVTNVGHTTGRISPFICFTSFLCAVFVQYVPGIVVSANRVFSVPVVYFP